MRVIIVGAGMAGLTAARRVRGAGHEVVVLDKSRAVGGRMASKRIGSARFDTGAQHFSARSPEFQASVAEWIRRELVTVWYEGRSVTNPARGVEPRHIGVGGMREIPEALAQGLDVRTTQHVDRLQLGSPSVTITTTDTAFEGDVVIVTSPLPQALTILEASQIPAPHELGEVRYDPTLAVMALLEGPSDLSDGHSALDSGPIAWIGDNQHKGVSPDPAVTIHSSAAFAQEFLEAEPSSWVPLLVDAAQPFLAASVIDATGHRWRYSQPRNPRSDGAMALAEGRVIIAGEAFMGAKVEGAYLSGVRAAELVLQRD